MDLVPGELATGTLSVASPAPCSNLLHKTRNADANGPRSPDIMDVKNLNEVPAFITKDGSEIRELLAYRNSVICNQSLAEARLPVGTSTQEHYHGRAEEIYFITAGMGRMRIEGEMREVKDGDAIDIPPGK